MGKYKFESEAEAASAQAEILLKGWMGVSEQEGEYIRTKTQDLTADLIVEIEKVIKKHGGKGKFISGLI
ncbi:MAG: hypothetical protein IPJ71_15780 [Bdellovibrionales bacterium]|nr:hypothetical protein [Bdellovibrionales bacterium]